MQSNLIGTDRRGGKGYKEVFCEVCGNPMFIGKDSEGGICARCVQFGYPKLKTEINIVEVKQAMDNDSLKRYRKDKKLSQDSIADFLGISRMQYYRIENGDPVGKNIYRKIEKKLAQAEQGQ